MKYYKLHTECLHMNCNWLKLFLNIRILPLACFHTWPPLVANIDVDETIHSTVQDDDRVLLLCSCIYLLHITFPFPIEIATCTLYSCSTLALDSVVVPGADQLHYTMHSTRSHNGSSVFYVCVDGTHVDR